MNTELSEISVLMEQFCVCKRSSSQPINMDVSLHRAPSLLASLNFVESSVHTYYHMLVELLLHICSRARKCLKKRNVLTSTIKLHRLSFLRKGRFCMTPHRSGRIHQQWKNTITQAFHLGPICLVPKRS